MDTAASAAACAAWAMADAASDAAVGTGGGRPGGGRMDTARPGKNCWFFTTDMVEVMALNLSTVLS